MRKIFVEDKERGEMSAEGRKEGAGGWCVKFLIANILAFILLSCVGYFYRSGRGDLPYSRICCSAEGYVVLNLDANALNNGYFLETGLPTNSCDVLVMGSSHIEAQQVQKDKNCVYLLNRRFENQDSPLTFYSCGISGYFLTEIVARYEVALQEYGPKKYALIEMFGMAPSIASIDNALSPKIYERYDWRTENVDSWGKTIRSLGAMRWMWPSRMPANVNNEIVKKDGKISRDNVNAWDTAVADMAKKLMSTSERYGVKPIIFYHGHKYTTLGYNGEFVPTWDVEKIKAFRAICEREGIIFVDVTERFRKEYEENNVWPYGFCNAGIVSGHLNRDGHRMVADVLEEKIRELEAENKESEAKQ